MSSLASKDSYLQSLGRKVCAQQNTEPRKRKIDFINRDGSDEFTKPKKKKKPRKAKHERSIHHIPPKLVKSSPRSQSTGLGASQSTFSTVNILKNRLQEKLLESRGQVSNKNLTPEEIEKRRQRRKQERERKKKKRKAIKMSAEQAGEQSENLETTETPKNEGQVMDQTPLVFNKVEVNDEPLNKVMLKKEKKERVKGKLTPLTGKNYKQLLSRLEIRNNKLEDLRAKDQNKANELESKMKWTNVLYKAEGVKIKDDEGMLKVALKRKEKQRQQRKNRWDSRTEHTAERVQKRQDKRHRNIQKKKMKMVDTKKAKARKKGRVLPEDLNKARLK